MYILSADFGTTSLKLSIVDESLKIISSIKQAYDYDLINDIWCQIDPEVIFRAFIDGLGRFDIDPGKIDILSICVLCPALIAMNRDGKSLYPAIIHLDRRSVKQAKRALQIVGKKRFLEINGNLPFPGGISFTSILWLRENQPDVYKRTFVFGHLNTYLQKIFTDKFVIDPTNASFTGLYETLKWGGWSRELCSALDIPISKLPDIVPSHQILGGLKKRASVLTGLKEGIPVVMGANDTSSAALGAGAIENGSILNISGSNEIITITTDRPIPHERVYLRTHAIEGRWLILAITTGGCALEWFREEFYREMDSKFFYEEYFPDFIKNRFRKSEIIFLPYLAGDRHNITQKRARFDGITLDTGREDFLAALLQGMFEPITMVMDIYSERIALKKEIILTGGMVNNAYLDFKRGIFKDFCFKRVIECSTIGNARLALMGLKHC